MLLLLASLLVRDFEFDLRFGICSLVEGAMAASNILHGLFVEGNAPIQDLERMRFGSMECLVTYVFSPESELAQVVRVQIVEFRHLDDSKVRSRMQ